MAANALCLEARQLRASPRQKLYTGTDGQLHPTAQQRMVKAHGCGQTRCPEVLQILAFTAAMGGFAPGPGSGPITPQSLRVPPPLLGYKMPGVPEYTLRVRVHTIQGLSHQNNCYMRWFPEWRKQPMRCQELHIKQTAVNMLGDRVLQGEQGCWGQHATGHHLPQESPGKGLRVGMRGQGSRGKYTQGEEHGNVTYPSL